MACKHHSLTCVFNTSKDKIPHCPGREVCAVSSPRGTLQQQLLVQEHFLPVQTLSCLEINATKTFYYLLVKQIQIRTDWHSALGLKVYPTRIFYFFKINLWLILHKLNWFLKIFIQELQQQFSKSVAEFLRRMLEATRLVFQPSLFHSSKSPNSSPMPSLQ